MTSNVHNRASHKIETLSFIHPPHIPVTNGLAQWLSAVGAGLWIGRPLKVCVEATSILDLRRNRTTEINRKNDAGIILKRLSTTTSMKSVSQRAGRLLISLRCRPRLSCGVVWYAVLGDDIALCSQIPNPNRSILPSIDAAFTFQMAGLEHYALVNIL